MRETYIEIPKPPLSQDRRQTPEELKIMLEKGDELRLKLPLLVEKKEADVMTDGTGKKILRYWVYNKDGRPLYFEDVDALEKAFSKMERSN